MRSVLSACFDSRESPFSSSGFCPVVHNSTVSHARKTVAEADNSLDCKGFSTGDKTPRAFHTQGASP